MTFILAADGRDDDVESSFKRYRHYLTSVRDVFPPSAYNIATSDWYWHPNDRRCPHDARLESCNLYETVPDSLHESRAVAINIILLGAYHDRYIKLRYPRIFSYQFKTWEAGRGHCDWRYDELRLSENGNLIHEIEWHGGEAIGSWLIEASDLEIEQVLIKE
jgi:hypothetical protein